jgi:RNA polymerase sigma factor (sigma-70 family)
MRQFTPLCEKGHQVQMTPPPVMEPLEDLMVAAQDGDAKAYRRLLDDVASRTRRLIRADVEDVVQDTLLSLHAARATWDSTRPFMPWLYSIARNRLADHSRRYGRKVALDFALTEFTETFSNGPANGHAEGVVNFLSVKQAMTELSPAERDAMHMLRFRQLSLAEASAESGASVAALKVAVHRAGKRLRAVLKLKE